jgi:hypothetical protein
MVDKTSEILINLANALSTFSAENDHAAAVMVVAQAWSRLYGVGWRAHAGGRYLMQAEQIRRNRESLSPK